MSLVLTVNSTVYFGLVWFGVSVELVISFTQASVGGNILTGCPFFNSTFMFDFYLPYRSTVKKKIIVN